MREIPDNININETTTGGQEEMDNIIFDEHVDDGVSDDDDAGLPHHNKNRGTLDSPSEGESDDDDDEDFHNPNRLPKNSGNLNAGNLIGKKKESGKGARNDRRQAISGSESEGHDELAHI